MTRCEVCRAMFVPMRGAAGRFCSPECDMESRVKSRAPRKATCLLCGKRLVHDYSKKPKSYCDKTCGNRSRAQKYLWMGVTLNVLAMARIAGISTAAMAKRMRKSGLRPGAALPTSLLSEANPGRRRVSRGARQHSASRGTSR